MPKTYNDIADIADIDYINSVLAEAFGGGSRKLDVDILDTDDEPTRPMPRFAIPPPPPEPKALPPVDPWLMARARAERGSK